MNIKDISVPEIYKTSWDFRFFLKWFEYCLTKVHHDTENFLDLYDPLKCPSWLLWMLGDTMGYKYDERLSAAFNRLVMVYFMSMIRYKGSKDGVTLAAEVNLAQFNLQNYAKEKDILSNRLEDTSIPVNSVYVSPHVHEGYIDVVYFSDKEPIDACIEYVRPLGMYLFQHAGIRLDARTKISVDARLTNSNNIGMSIGPTHVGHYRREDYARLQKMQDSDLSENKVYIPDVEGVPRADREQGITNENLSHTRNGVWYRNSEYEGEYDPDINPGYRALYSLQLCNNEHIFDSLIPSNAEDGDLPNGKKKKIFGIGYNPQDVSVDYTYVPEWDEIPDVDLEPTGPNDDPKNRIRPWNLRVDTEREEGASPYPESPDVYTVEKPPYGDRTEPGDYAHPHPAVNPVMGQIGDALSMNHMNTQYGMMSKEEGPGIYKAETDGQLTDKLDKDEFDVEQEDEV